jgi:hypothetical protein
MLMFLKLSFDCRVRSSTRFPDDMPQEEWMFIFRAGGYEQVCLDKRRLHVRCALGAVVFEGQNHVAVCWKMKFRTEDPLDKMSLTIM